MREQVAYNTCSRHLIPTLAFTMALIAQDIHKLAQLARIKMTEQESATTLAKLRDILQSIDQMRSVDTHGIVPMSHPQDVMQPLRADRVGEVNQRELFQSQAPAVSDGLYLVPKIIE